MEREGRWFGIGIGLVLVVCLGLGTLRDGPVKAVNPARPATPGPPPSIRYVDLGGTCAGLTPCDTSIGAAVAAASGGDLIRVFPGTYVESVNLSTMASVGDVQLMTVNSSGVPTPGTATIAPATGQALYTQASFWGDVHIVGFVVGSTDGDAVALTVIGGRDVRIDYLTATGAKGDGLAVVSDGGYITVTNTIATFNGGQGFNLRAASDVTVRDSSANDNVQSDDDEVRRYSDGIEIKDVQGDVRVINVTANRNRGSVDNDGIEVGRTGGSVLLRNVTAMGNSDGGFDLWQTGGTVTVEGAIVRDHAERGVWFTDGGNSPALKGSILCGNDPGVSVGYATTVDAEANWWGCAAGPGSPGCDTVDHNDGTIDADPWIDTLSVTTTISPVNAGDPTEVRFQFSGGGGTVFLSEGPGDMHGTAPFTVTTDNGTLTDADETHATVHSFVGDADGILAVTLRPFWGEEAWVQLEGPCGLSASVRVPVNGDPPKRVYLPLALRQ